MLGSVNAFLEWWTDGLLAVIPERWRRVRRWPRRWVVVTRADGGYRAVVYENDRLSDEFELSTGFDGTLADSSIPPTVRQAVDDPRVPVIFRLHEREVLFKTARFPATVKRDLGRIVRYEIDRQTPFRADDVHFGARVEPSPDDADSLSVTLVVARKKALDDALEPLRAAGLRFTGVDVETCTLPETGVNLAADGLQAGERPPHLQRAILAAVLVAMVTLVPLRGLFEIEEEIERVQDLERSQRARLAELKPLREQVARIRQKANFIENVEAKHVDAVDLLREITRLLPDRSWLNRLNVNGDRLTLQGESHEAVVLPQLFEASSLFSDPTFSAALTRNVMTGAERFTLSARVVVRREP